MARLRWGVKTAPQHTTYDAMLAVWQEADRTPAFEHAWLFDHFAPIQGDLDGPCFEGWTLLAALAAQTSRLRLGLMVAGNTYRHPAVHAHMAATVDVISNGRLDFGVGAGWNEYEHQSMGIPLYPPGERIRRLGEACEITRRLWTQHLTDFDGRYYQLTQARCEPKPIQKPYPPFVIGGSGEQLTLRVVARYADVWNSTPADVEEFRHKVRRPARALRRRRPRSRADRAVGAGAGQLRRPRGDGRDAPAARRRRRDPPRPDAGLSLSRRDRRPAGRRGGGEGRLTSILAAFGLVEFLALKILDR